MAQVTVYLSDDIEVLARKRAETQKRSLSAYLAGLLARDVAPATWPKSLLDVLNEGAADLEVPEDQPPEEVNPIT